MAAKTKSRKSSGVGPRSPMKVEAGGADPQIIDHVVAEKWGDALIGHFGTVIKGEHEGLYGVVEEGADFDPKTGRPRKLFFRTRDASAQVVVVNYEDVKYDVAGGRR